MSSSLWCNSLITSCSLFAHHIFVPEHGGSAFSRNVNVYHTKRRHYLVLFIVTTGTLGSNFRCISILTSFTSFSPLLFAFLLLLYFPSLYISFVSFVCTLLHVVTLRCSLLPAPKRHKNASYFPVISTFRRTQWSRGMRLVPSSPSRTLGSCVRISLKAWMYMCVYYVFVYVAALQRAEPPSNESYQLCIKANLSLCLTN
jgi:hypothetical protein